MTRTAIGTAFVLLSTLLSSCGGDSTSPSPTTGTIDFNIVTSGVDIDGDGFSLAVDGGSPQAVPATGSLSITAAPGVTHWPSVESRSTAM